MDVPGKKDEVTMGLAINCPECQAQLTVAAQAAGRMGRCPICRGTFRVPDENQLLDEVVGTWLDATVQENLREEERESPSAVQSAAGSAAPAQQSSKPPLAPPPHRTAQPAAAAAESVTDHSAAPHEPSLKLRVPSARASVPHGVTDPNGLAPASSNGAAGSNGSNGTSAATPHRRDAVNIMVEDPRLHVEEVSAAGVTIAFHSSLLMRIAFRASMPFCCMQCGQRDSRLLIARPLSWIDRAHGVTTNPAEIETLLSIHVRAMQTPREVLSHMPLLEHLNSPFNEPIPYFACQQCAPHMSISCQTYMTPAGIQCQVIIPAGRYALEWLGRVNGVIGDDYASLESQVHHFDSDEWRSVPAQVRQRLSGWFDFEGGEQFLAYFSDSDFPKKDAGLAGIVLTTHRIVYCKFNHKGALSLTGDGELVVITDGPFCNLSYRVDRAARRMVRLRIEDTQRLLDMLAEMNSTLHVTAAEADRHRAAE
jgi:Zn-finger nucleic acid-binding protein